jgi:hypothetical protein
MMQFLLLRLRNFGNCGGTLASAPQRASGEGGTNHKPCAEWHRIGDAARCVVVRQ